jgi:hypothetical protein
LVPPKTPPECKCLGDVIPAWPHAVCSEVVGHARSNTAARDPSTTLYNHYPSDKVFVHGCPASLHRMYKVQNRVDPCRDRRRRTICNTLGDIHKRLIHYPIGLLPVGAKVGRCRNCLEARQRAPKGLHLGLYATSADSLHRPFGARRGVARLENLNCEATIISMLDRVRIHLSAHVLRPADKEHGD